MGVSWISTASTVGGVFGTFLGLLSVLTLTGKWSQRTAMTTFALEPRRGRVLAAKGAVLGLATTLLIAVALASGAAVVAGLRAGGLTASWDLPASQLGGLAAMTFFNIATGAAFGLLLLHSAAGLVAFLAVPMLWGLVDSVAMVWEPLSQVAPWLVPISSTLALQNGTIAGSSGGNWPSPPCCGSHCRQPWGRGAGCVARSPERRLAASPGRTRILES